MKKVLGLALALALALTMAMAVSAELSVDSINEVGNDIQQVFSDLTAQFGVEEVKAAVVGYLEDMDIDAATDAGDLPPNAGETLAGVLIGRFGLEDTDFADKLTKAMSNDFVSFLAQMYVKPEDVIPTTEPPIGPKTGDSSVIAIATFAALSVAAAAAFVCLKKKED